MTWEDWHSVKKTWGNGFEEKRYFESPEIAKASKEMGELGDAYAREEYARNAGPDDPPFPSCQRDVGREDGPSPERDKNCERSFWSTLDCKEAEREAAESGAPSKEAKSYDDSASVDDQRDSQKDER